MNTLPLNSTLAGITIEPSLIWWLLVQSTLIGIVTYIAASMAYRVASAARVWLVLIGLSLMTLVPIVSSWHPFRWNTMPAATTASATNSHSETTPTKSHSANSVQNNLTPSQNVEPNQPTDAAPPAWATTVDAWLNSTKELLTPPPTPSPQSAQPSLHSPSHWGWLLILVGATLGVARLAYGAWQVARLKRSSTICNDPTWENDLTTIASQLGVKKLPTLATTPQLESPAIIGYRRPILLLPTRYETLSVDERRAIIAHELAHVRRGDVLATLVAHLAVATNFFHPLAHLLNRRLRLEQELAADSLAAEIVGGHLPYVQTLAGLALRQPRVRPPGSALAFLPARRMFVRRLEMLRSLDQIRRLPRWTNCYTLFALCGMLALATMITGLRPLPAQTTALQDFGSSLGSNEEDLKPLTNFLPADATELAIEIDVEKVWTTPAMQQILKAYKDEPALINLGSIQIDPNHVASVLVAVFADQSRPQSSPLVITRLKDKEHMPDTEKPGLVQIDEQTFVFGGSEALREAVIYMASLPNNTASDQEITAMLKEHQDAPIRLAFRNRLFRDLLAEENRRLANSASPFAAFAPLWEAVDQGSAGLKLSDALALDISLDTKDPESVADTVVACKTLATNWIRHFTVERQSSSDPAQNVMMAVWKKHALDGLKSIEVTPQDGNVSVSAKLDNSYTTALALALPAIQSAREAARRTQSMNNMKQIMLALHNYHDAHGHFPPAVVLDESGHTRSWRIEILPYLEQSRLYDEYRKDEPWSSEANLAVMAKIPPVFKPLTDITPPDAKYAQYHTPYLALGGEHQALSLSDGEAPRLRDFTDGTSNTIAVVENSATVPWTQPIDFTDENPDLTNAWRDGIFLAAFTDGSVRAISKSIDAAMLKALMTRDMGEPISP